MPFTQLQDATVYYEVEGSGPSLVFAHGAGGNHLSWWQQVPVFSDRYRCVVFDHPQFGQSAWNDSNSADVLFGDVLADLLIHLGIEKCALVAQSMGGWTALGLVERRPEMVDALVLAATYGGVHTAEIDELLRARETKMLAARRAWEYQHPGSFNPALGERAANDQPALHYLYSEIGALNPERAAADRSAWGDNRTEDAARGISIPTLLISGEEDIIVPTQAIEALHPLIPGSRLEKVPESGHSVYFERPETFNEILSEFLAETYPA